MGFVKAGGSPCRSPACEQRDGKHLVDSIAGPDGALGYIEPVVARVRSAIAHHC